MYTDPEEDTSVVDDSPDLERTRSFELVHKYQEEKQEKGEGKKEVDTVRILCLTWFHCTLGCYSRVMCVRTGCPHHPP